MTLAASRRQRLSLGYRNRRRSQVLRSLRRGRRCACRWDGASREAVSAAVDHASVGQDQVVREEAAAHAWLDSGEETELSARQGTRHQTVVAHVMRRYTYTPHWNAVTTKWPLFGELDGFR